MRTIIEDIRTRLAETEYGLFSLNYSVDRGAPCLGVGRVALVAFSPRRGAVVLELHDATEPVDLTWQRAMLIRDELREWTSVRAFPIQALILSEEYPWRTREVGYCDGFLGYRELHRLPATLKQVLGDGGAHPRFLDALRAHYIVVDEGLAFARAA